LSDVLGLTSAFAKQARKPISVAPVRAVRPMLTFRIVFAFLVRAAKQPVGLDNRLDPLRFKKVKNGLQDLHVLPRVLIR
jgi:acyl dehydratase